MSFVKVSLVPRVEYQTLCKAFYFGLIRLEANS